MEAAPSSQDYANQQMIPPASVGISPPADTGCLEIPTVVFQLFESALAGACHWIENGMTEPNSPGIFDREADCVADRANTLSELLPHDIVDRPGG